MIYGVGCRDVACMLRLYFLLSYYMKVIIYQFTPLPTNNHKLYKYYLC